MDIQNQDSHFPAAPKACGSKVKNLHSNLPGADSKNPALRPLTQKQIRLSETQTKGSRPLHGHHRPAHFRITLYWNQNRVSGSFFNWKMLILVPIGRAESCRGEGQRRGKLTSKGDGHVLF